jgi:hypothetical protein
MKQTLKTLLMVFISLLWLNSISAQINLPPNKKFKQPLADSLLREIDNDIYYTYYSPAFMSNKVPVFTMLKVDIGWDGKVTSIQFSDSAGPDFIKAYFDRPKGHDIKATLEKYAKIKSYTDVSLLIPVSWEPNYPNQKKVFTYDEMEGIMKFNKKDFTGKSIMFSPIYITLSATGNM